MVMIAAVAVMAALVVVLSVVQAARYDHPRATIAGAPAPLAVGTALQRPRPVPSVGLIDANGKPVSLNRWHGKWVVLAPSLTLCHEVCPMTTGALMQLTVQLRRAGLSKQVAVVEATVDPWRDTPARLRAYRRLSGADFPLLTGTRAAIHRLWKFFGVYYARVAQGKPPDVDWLTGKPETFDVNHTDAVFIIDPAGQERIIDEGMPSVSGQLSRPLRRLLNDQGRHNLAHPQLAWTAGELVEDLYYLMNRNVPASALAKVSAPSPSAAARALAGSPHPLAALHAQAGRLLSASASLSAELRALRGYPVVLNLWASWCGPCRSEFPLFASASAVYGRRVAFLANDTNDSPSDARTFLAQHPVSYPSFQESPDALTSLAQLQGLPMTIFINRSGHVVHINTGAYASRTRLVQDIERYALGV
jgi:cytochrome oxidase Cu insertion factor (SCO1/SenC/PrrC family)/thiol-disulfide isomerase/thioredoxin